MDISRTNWTTGKPPTSRPTDSPQTTGTMSTQTTTNDQLHSECQEKDGESSFTARIYSTISTDASTNTSTDLHALNAGRKKDASTKDKDTTWTGKFTGKLLRSHHGLKPNGPTNISVGSKRLIICYTSSGRDSHHNAHNAMQLRSIATSRNAQLTPRRNNLKLFSKHIHNGCSTQCRIGHVSVSPLYHITGMFHSICR